MDFDHSYNGFLGSKSPAPQQQGYSMNKLVCSFRSDLPNEIDFGMQVATLLANTDNFTWSQDYPIIDAICSSLHAFVSVCEDESNDYSYTKFWYNILGPNSSNEFLRAAACPPDIDPSFVNFESFEDDSHSKDPRIYKRIKSAAEIIKQFSLTANQKTNGENYNVNKKKKPKVSPHLLKFVSLLIHCSDKTLNLLGLDILSNIASKLCKVPERTNDVVCAKLVRMFQEYCVDCIIRPDGDIYLINRSIEVISRIIASSSLRVSSSIINLLLEKDLVARIEQFLTSYYDITLFLSALECCYRISRHQPNLLAGKTKYLVKILVNLLDCDDYRYFTSRALKRIKLIDEDSDEQPENNTTQSQVNALKPSQNNSQPPTISVQPLTYNVTPLTNNSPPPVPQTKEYICEWDNCNMKFTDTKKVYPHVFGAHIEALAPDSTCSCLWSGPNGSGPGCLTKRPKFSLLTHLNDFHCSHVALERALNRSQPIRPPELPVYEPDAALAAVKRGTNSHMELTNGSRTQIQSALSVSVRLTAALILRNLASQSLEVKQALENYEQLLSEICMTNGRDESKIIAECLSLISDSK